MKLKIVMSVLAFGLFAASSNASVVSDVISQITSRKPASYICRKASLLDFSFSIRSGSGVACKNKAVGAIAELLCTKSNYDDYANSGCHKNAVTALGDKTAQEVLVAEAIALGGTVATGICVAASSSFPVLMPACGLIKAVVK